jgi:AraC-like DNA-binding protein
MTQPLVRSAALSKYADLARSAGLDPVAMVAEVGIDPVCLDEPDLRIPVASVGSLLDNSARRTGWSDFAFRLAESRAFSVSGPLAMLAREQAVLRDAIAVHNRFMHLHNEALHVWLEEDALTASLRLEYPGLKGPTRQTVELSVAMSHRWLRQTLPEGWRPRLVCFTHEPQPDMRSAMRLFPKVEYLADFNGIIFSAKDLNLPVAGYAQLERYARQYVDSIATHAGRTTTEKVRQLALTLLPLGAPTLGKIARSLGLDERSVRRRLAKEGSGFNEVLNQMRLELVQRYLLGVQRKHTEIALLLGFTGSTVFARWFRGQFGCTPSEWIERQRAGVPGGR